MFYNYYLILFLQSFTFWCITYDYIYMLNNVVECQRIFALDTELPAAFNEDDILSLQCLVSTECVL